MTELPSVSRLGHRVHWRFRHAVWISQEARRSVIDGEQVGELGVIPEVGEPLPLRDPWRASNVFRWVTRNLRPLWGRRV